jgi:sugar phosphate isomerase/epimerase
MQLGISSYSYSWAIGVAGFESPRSPMDAFGLLERAIMHGVSVLQVADNLPLTALPTGELGEFSERAQAAKVAIEVGTRGIEPENLRTYLALARRFGAPFVRVVIDRKGDEPAPAEAVARLRPLLPEFADAGVALAIENHDRFRAKTLAAMVEALGPEHVGICLDTVNSFGALEGPDVVVATLKPYVRNLHVKDFTIRRLGHQMGFVIEGCPAGKGKLDVPWLMGQLPPGISAILEIWTPLGGSMEETVAREAEWADESIAYLKPLLGSDRV